MISKNISFKCVKKKFLKNLPAYFLMFYWENIHLEYQYFLHKKQCWKAEKDTG